MDEPAENRDPGAERTVSGPGRALREIVAAGQVRSRFQPIVQLSDGQVVAHEALSRGPEETELECPRRLFEAAAEQGCELELDAACRAFALLRAAEAGWRAGADGPLFLNLRPGALAHPGFLPGLQAAVAAVGRAPGDVVLEVSEAERVDEGVQRALAGCRAAGYWLALDDAGAGMCGLQAIVEVVPDVVKVDRTLVGGMDRHRGRRAAVAALARLARDLGIVLVAEGIETGEELRVARDLGVPLGQGFLLGAPSAELLLGGRGAVFPSGALPPVGSLRAAPVRVPVRTRRRGRPGIRSAG